VSSVSISVSVRAVDSVISPSGTSTKVRVTKVDTGINDIGIDAGAGGGIVDVVGSGARAVRDGAKTPRGDRGLSGLL
jgi:hypothetical protein